jgi:hypothetical protein
MNTFVIVQDGRATLSCTIEDRWDEILLRPLACGQKFKREITRKVGVTREDREQLEASVKSSLGLEGLARLESHITATTGQTITFEEVTEVKDTMEVEAPKCGRYTLLVYQGSQLLHFEYNDPGWFHTTRWTLTVQKWLERFADESTRVVNDPKCGCDPTPDAGGHVQLAVIAVDRRFGMLTTSTLGPQGLNLLDLGATVPPKGTASIPLASIPRHLRFLARLDGEADAASAGLPVRIHFMPPRSAGPAGREGLALRPAASWDPLMAGFFTTLTGVVVPARQEDPVTQP